MNARRSGWSLLVSAVALACGAAFAPGVASADPVLAAVGDIACHPGNSVIGTACQQRATATLVASQPHDAVALLGDVQYNQGLIGEFMGTAGAGGFNVSWGRFNPIAHPEVGNHEYSASATAAGYFQYFGAHGVGDGGPPGYYSYDLGNWHIVALNSNCSDSACADSLTGSTTKAQVSWLQADLAVHPHRCILAYWHHPRFTSGGVPASPGVTPLWNALLAAHADVVLNGHDHVYERFAQQDASGNLTNQGIREFVVGTGGESLDTAKLTYPHLQATDDKDFGALFVTLHPYGYDWTMRSAGTGKTGHASPGDVKDSSPASVACHALPPPAITSPSDGSYNNTGAFTLAGTATPNSTVTIFDGFPSQGTTTANASGAWSKVVSGVADGTHSYTATATDGTGNGSPASTADHVIVDRVPPTTSITSGPSGVISQSSVSFGFASSEAGSFFQCELAGPGSQPGSFSPCASPATYANLADGAYTFAVQASDPAGNPDPNPPARSFTVQSATGGGSHGGPSPLATQAMTSLGLSPPTFRAASSGPSATRARTKAGARARTGSTITFTLRMAGRVRYTVEAPLSGRRVHGRCVAASKSNHRSPACTRYRALRGTFSLVGVAGVNRFHFTGRLAGKKLAPGRYRLVATPSGGAPVRAAFRIKR